MNNWASVDNSHKGIEIAGDFKVYFKFPWCWEALIHLFTNFKFMIQLFLIRLIYWSSKCLSNIFVNTTKQVSNHWWGASCIFCQIAKLPTISLNVTSVANEFYNFNPLFPHAHLWMWLFPIIKRYCTLLIILKIN